MLYKERGLKMLYIKFVKLVRKLRSGQMYTMKHCTELNQEA